MHDFPNGNEFDLQDGFYLLLHTLLEEELHYGNVNLQ